MTTHALQGTLPLIRKVTPAPVSSEVLHACKDMLSAFNLAVNVSGLEEKEIYLALNIDPGHWSRIRKGEAHFPMNKLNEFCDIVQNEIALEYWAWSRGKGLHLLVTEAERLLQEAQEALRREQEKTRLLTDVLQGRALA